MSHTFTCPKCGETFEMTVPCDDTTPLLEMGEAIRKHGLPSINREPNPFWKNQNEDVRERKAQEYADKVIAEAAASTNPWWKRDQDRKVDLQSLTASLNKLWEKCKRS